MCGGGKWQCDLNMAECTKRSGSGGWQSVQNEVSVADGRVYKMKCQWRMAECTK